MAKISSSVVVALSPADAFAALTEFDHFSDWLVFHDGWRGETPTREAMTQGATVASVLWRGETPTREAMTQGATVASVLVVKGATAPFTWTVDTYSPPKDFRFSGKEKGVKVSISMSVEPADGGSEVSFQLELGGLPMVGPVGKAVVRSLSGEVEESMQRFGALFGA